MDKRRNISPASRIAKRHEIEQKDAGDVLGMSSTGSEIRTLRGRTEIFKEEMFDIMSGLGFHEEVQGYFETPGTMPYASIPRQSKNRNVAEYTLNPNAETPPYSQSTINVLDVEYFARHGLIGKPIAEVLQYLVDNLSNKYTFPDVRFSKWYERFVKEGDTDLNMSGEDGPVYVLIGSRLQFSDGETGVAAYHIDSGELVYDMISLDKRWERNMWLIYLKRKEA